MRRREVITLGEPLSVNAELIASSLVSLWLRPWPVFIVGCVHEFQRQCAAIGLATPLDAILTPEASLPDTPGVYGLELFATPLPPAEDMSMHQRGQLAIAALEWAAAQHQPGVRLAVTTAPIDKHVARAAGFAFPGQTEFFEARWRAPAVMTLVGPQLRVGLVTNHLALREVVGAIDAQGIVDKGTLLVHGLRELLGRQPRIAVCGLNPHCGDQGEFGDEDREVIAPAVARLTADGCAVEGPLPADTVFFRAKSGDYDAVLAMYHDQGLGPLKVVHFDDAVNISLGLPALRVSPDHGPARDLYLSGEARTTSFAACLALTHKYLAHPATDG